MLINNFISSFTGTVYSLPRKITVHEELLSFDMKILRNSGYEDIIEVITDNFSLQLNIGDSIRVVGFLYTHQNCFTEYPRLCVCIYSTAIVHTSYVTNKNVVICQGTVVKQPVLRQTPSGITICDALLAVNNELSQVFASYVPTICWNALARRMSTIDIGTPIYAVGRLQSRIYEKEVDGKMQSFKTHEFSINTFKILESTDGTKTDKEDLR